MLIKMEERFWVMVSGQNSSKIASKRIVFHSKWVPERGKRVVLHEKVTV